MNKFDDREKSFEKKFQIDQELQFKVQSRSNKYLAEFVSLKLGKTEEEKAKAATGRAAGATRSDREPHTGFAAHNALTCPALYSQCSNTPPPTGPTKINKQLGRAPQRAPRGP